MIKNTFELTEIKHKTNLIVKFLTIYENDSILTSGVYVLITLMMLMNTHFIENKTAMMIRLQAIV